MSITPRQAWFRKRIDEAIEEIIHISRIEDWDEYKDKAHEVALEILYATTEWDKYYRNINNGK
jgi:hypothetical protein